MPLPDTPLTPRDRSVDVIPAGWGAADIPDQSGRVAVVTGGTSGLGTETALELARHGAYVVLTARDAARGEQAAEQIRAAVPGASVEVGALDLADLASVRAFAALMLSTHDRIDVLINNAGVMATPRKRTADGFELQFGTNHLGHFALTGQLLPLLRASSGARVVAVSSGFAAIGRLDLDDLTAAGRYGRWLAYGRSKLADLVFARELDRRARAAGVALTALAAHPGYAATNLQTAGMTFPPARWFAGGLNALVATDAAQGALPSLAAATLEDVPGGSFVGPGRLLGYRGSPAVVRPPSRATSRSDAQRLWAVSEEATGVRFDL